MDLWFFAGIADFWNSNVYALPQCPRQAFKIQANLPPRNDNLLQFYHLSGFISGFIFSSVFDGYKFWVPLIFCGVEALMLMLGAACSIVLARKLKLHYLFTVLTSVLSLLFITTIIIAVFMV